MCKSNSKYWIKWEKNLRLEIILLPKSFYLSATQCLVSTINEKQTTKKRHKIFSFNRQINILDSEYSWTSCLTWHDSSLLRGWVCTQWKATTFGQSITEEGDVFLQSAGIFGHGQLAAESQCLLLGALWQTSS